MVPVRRGRTRRRRRTATGTESRKASSQRFTGQGCAVAAGLVERDGVGQLSPIGHHLTQRGGLGQPEHDEQGSLHRRHSDDMRKGQPAEPSARAPGWPAPAPGRGPPRASPRVGSTGRRRRRPEAVAARRERWRPARPGQPLPANRSWPEPAAGTPRRTYDHPMWTSLPDPQQPEVPIARSGVAPIRKLTCAETHAGVRRRSRRRVCVGRRGRAGRSPLADRPAMHQALPALSEWDSRRTWPLDPGPTPFLPPGLNARYWDNIWAQTRCAASSNACTASSPSGPT